MKIYRGVLTGCNEAFIISTEKRDEILANCATEDERSRTDELIRPILRGRDIKRYGYEWAGKYIIALFPSRNYDIDCFPAVRAWLLSFAKEVLLENGRSDLAVEPHLSQFCRQRLEQSGKAVLINHTAVILGGKQVKARKKTHNKWFETQDSISYWEDFLKPKIAWNRIASEKEFSLVKSGVYIADSMHFITFDAAMLPKDAHEEEMVCEKVLCTMLNSSPIQWMLSKIVGDAVGGNAGNADNIKNLSIPTTTIDQQRAILELFVRVMESIDKEIGPSTMVNESVDMIFKLSSSEIDFIKQSVS